MTLTSSTIRARLMWLPTALSRKSGMIACFDSIILHELERLDIKEAQGEDGELWAIVQNVEDGKHTEFSVDDDSVVWFEDRLCVPNAIYYSSRFNQDVQRFETVLLVERHEARGGYV
ncbi:hypothetical protein Tco_0229180, partial [Tanacetum coccineum]